jgi:hypothetical protein
LKKKPYTYIIHKEKINVRKNGILKAKREELWLQEKKIYGY